MLTNALYYGALSALLVLVGISVQWNVPAPDAENKNIAQSVNLASAAPCLQMYYYIEKYAKEYAIPRNYAYGVANVETGYQHPFQWNYNHAQGSRAGALGPMQIMPATAKWMWPDSSFTKSRLRNDIEFNVRTSMKLLRHLHDKYGDWKVVFGCYNTGKKIVNKYALRVYNYQIPKIPATK